MASRCFYHGIQAPQDHRAGERPPSCSFRATNDVGRPVQCRWNPPSQVDCLLGFFGAEPERLNRLLPPSRHLVPTETATRTESPLLLPVGFGRRPIHGCRTQIFGGFADSTSPVRRFKSTQWAVEHLVRGSSLSPTTSCPSFPTCGQPPPSIYTVSTTASELMNTISTLSDLGSFFYDLLISFVLFAPLYFLMHAIYQLRLSPLSSIPGPWYAAISDFWLFSHALRLQQSKTIHSLFARYGPVVRIGPNKVAFCDLSVTKNVYIGQKFDKSDFYKSLLTWVFMLNLNLKNPADGFRIGTTTITRTYTFPRSLDPGDSLISALRFRMTTLPHSQHLVRKKGYIPHYVQAHINLFQPEMHDSTCELVEVGFGTSDYPLS